MSTFTSVDRRKHVTCGDFLSVYHQKMTSESEQSLWEVTKKSAV